MVLNLTSTQRALVHAGAYFLVKARHGSEASEPNERGGGGGGGGGQAAL